jgi:hypothetical protein
MITAAANSEKLLTRLMTDALTKMRRSRGRFFFADGAFSMHQKRAATTNDARRDWFIWWLRPQGGSQSDADLRRHAWRSRGGYESLSFIS